MSTPNPAALALAEAALKVARRRAAELDRIREALIEGDDAEALRLMREHLSVEELKAGVGRPARTTKAKPKGGRGES